MVASTVTFAFTIPPILACIAPPGEAAEEAWHTHVRLHSKQINRRHTGTKRLEPGSGTS